MAVLRKSETFGLIWQRNSWGSGNPVLLAFMLYVYRRTYISQNVAVILAAGLNQGQFLKTGAEARNYTGLTKTMINDTQFGQRKTNLIIFQLLFFSSLNYSNHDSTLCYMTQSHNSRYVAWHRATTPAMLNRAEPRLPLCWMAQSHDSRYVAWHRAMTPSMFHRA
jgi:hypothetical protein